MPALRFETRPSSAGNATIVFGPWPRDILVRSISMNVTLDAGTAQAVPFVRMGNVDGNWLNLTPCGEDAVALGGESVQVQAYPGLAGPIAEITRMANVIHSGQAKS